MELIRTLAVAGCAAALAACATQPSSGDVAKAGKEDSTAVAAADDQPEGQYVDKVVCKRIYRTGTRTNSTRTCATVAEWEELSRQSQDATDNLSRRTGLQNMEGN